MLEENPTGKGEGDWLGFYAQELIGQIQLKQPLAGCIKNVDGPGQVKRTAHY